MHDYQLITATWDNIPRYLEILNSGREFQRAQGFIQWPDGYPAREDIQEDILSHKGYALTAGDAIAGYLYLGFDGDPAYPQIKGAWHYDAPYAVIHRIAIGEEFRGQGLADIAFRLAETICLKKGVFVLRIDTDGENKRMQHILNKNGFSYCGTVVQGGGDRLAFDKKLSAP